MLCYAITTPFNGEAMSFFFRILFFKAELIIIFKWCIFIGANFLSFYDIYFNICINVLFCRFFPMIFLGNYI